MITMAALVWELLLFHSFSFENDLFHLDQAKLKLNGGISKMLIYEFFHAAFTFLSFYKFLLFMSMT